MRNFKKLGIWINGIRLVKSTYLLCKKLPSDEKFGLISQMTRAAVSVPSNIAEGSSRASEKDYNRFLQIALGSLFELETLIIICQELEFLEESETEEIINKIEEKQKMIVGFMKKLNV